jgi:hypothetical protein
VISPAEAQRRIPATSTPIQDLELLLKNRGAEGDMVLKGTGYFSVLQTLGG